MPITVGPDYYSAHVKPTSLKRQISFSDQEKAYEILKAEKVIGGRYRYLSDRHFKTENAAKAYYEPLMKKHPHLRRMLDISRGFSLVF